MGTESKVEVPLSTSRKSSMKCSRPKKIPRLEGTSDSLVAVDSKIPPTKMRQKAMKYSEFVYCFQAKPSQLHQRRACAPLATGMRFHEGHGAVEKAIGEIIISSWVTSQGNVEIIGSAKVEE